MAVMAVLGTVAFISAVVCLVALIKAMEAGDEALVRARSSAFLAWTLLSIVSFELMPGCTP